MNKIPTSKLLEDTRIEKTVDELLDRKCSFGFIKCYFNDNVKLEEYIVSKDENLKVLDNLNRFCSAIHNRLLRKEKDAKFLRDFIIRSVTSEFMYVHYRMDNKVENMRRRRYHKILMTVFRYRTFGLSLIKDIIIHDKEVPYLDKKKIFNMYGEYFLRKSRRHIRTHFNVLTFFKKQVSSEHFNFIIDISRKRLMHRLSLKILLNFYEQLNDNQKEILRASLLLEEMK